MYLICPNLLQVQTRSSPLSLDLESVNMGLVHPHTGPNPGPVGSVWFRPQSWTELWTVYFQHLQNSGTPCKRHWAILVRLGQLLAISEHILWPSVTPALGPTSDMTYHFCLYISICFYNYPSYSTHVSLLKLFQMKHLFSIRKYLALSACISSLNITLVTYQISLHLVLSLSEIRTLWATKAQPIS